MKRMWLFLAFFACSATAFGGPAPGQSGAGKALPPFMSPEARQMAVDIAKGNVDPHQLIHSISPHAMVPPGAVYQPACSVEMSAEHKDDFGLMAAFAVYTFNLPMPPEMERAIKKNDNAALAKMKLAGTYLSSPAGKAYLSAGDFYKKAGFHIVDNGMYRAIDHPADEELVNQGRQLGVSLFQVSALALCPGLPSGPTLVLSIHVPKR